MVGEGGSVVMGVGVGVGVGVGGGVGWMVMCGGCYGGIGDE